MPRLFGRTGAVTIGTLRFTGLDFSFSVVRTSSREPNTAEIQIINLSEASRKRIEETEEQQVRLEAGYKSQDRQNVIFQGDLRKASSTRDGANIVTTIEAGDGERAIRGRRINRSFGPGTLLRTALRAAADALGIGEGNLADRALDAAFEGLGRVFGEGTVLSGNAADEMTGLAQSAGLEWSIQNGNLQLLGRGAALAAKAIVLRADTGLIGVPSIDSEGVVRARSLIVPDLFPGRKVEILSQAVRGFFAIEKATYTGDTTAGAQEWYVDIEAKVPTT